MQIIIDIGAGSTGAVSFTVLTKKDGKRVSKSRPLNAAEFDKYLEYLKDTNSDRIQFESDYLKIPTINLHPATGA